MTDYAVLCDDHLISVFEATTLLEAVRTKNHLQKMYNDMHGCDEVFELREATRAEKRDIDKTCAGLVAMPKT